MKDTIYREAAIDALAENMPSTYTPDGSHPADEGILMAQEIYADCIQTLKELPSVQPEIIRCRDCKYYRKYGYINGKPKFLPRCAFSSIYVNADDFCSRAERREE